MLTKKFFKKIVWEKTYRFCNLRSERISIKKNSLPYLKCVLRPSFVVHGPIYGRFMGFYVNGFLSLGPWTTKERRNTHSK